MYNLSQRHLLKICSAFRDACLVEPYSSSRLLKDLIAGLTVGIIAIPLAMALAIASGVPPQYGLYTAIIAGIAIAMTGPMLIGKTIANRKVKKPALIKFQPLAASPGNRLILADPH